MVDPEYILQYLDSLSINKKKGLVLGNGPSLNQVDFKALKKSDITTFATNRIAAICKREDWLPDFYVCVFAEPLRGRRIKLPKLGEELNYPGDISVAESAQRDIEYMCYNPNVTCFVHEYYRCFLKPELVTNSFFVYPRKWDRKKDLPESIFSKITPGQFMWHSATSQLFQLAFWLGIENIGIVGQDGFDLSLKINHYDGYVGAEQNRAKFDLANRRMEKLHTAVRNYVVNHGLETYNISEKSVISNWHKKASFEEFIKI